MESTTGTPQAMPQTTETQDPKQSGSPTPVGTQPQGNALKEAAAEAKRRMKIDDQEVDEDEVIKVYKDRKGHQRAANKELQEGRTLKKQNEEFVKLLKTNPIKVLSDPRIGHDVRKLAEEYLASQLEEEMLDPREKELRSAKNRLKAYEENERQQKEEVEKRHLETMKAKFSKDYETQFVDALKTTNLPATKPMVAEMAKYIARSAKIGFEMTALEAAKLVKEDIESAHRNLYGEADAETLVRLIGEQGLQKVRTYDTSRLKDPAAHLKTPTEQGEPSARARSTGKRMTPQEWREFNRK